MKSTTSFLNFLIIALGLLSPSLQGKYSEAKPEFGYVKSGEQTLFLACTKKSNICEEYKFFLREGHNEAQEISSIISRNNFQGLRNSSKNLKDMIKASIENFDTAYLAPTTYGIFSVVSLLTEKEIDELYPLAVLTGPIDLAILPITAIVHGFRSLHITIKRYRIKKAFQRMLGLRHLKITYLSKNSFEILLDLVKASSNMSPDKD